MRLPRICWECCMWIVAQAAKDSPSTFLLLLSLMTASTALIDIFLWGPIFATFASFETCTGGGWFSTEPRRCVTDYEKGFGRLVVSVTKNLLVCLLAVCAHSSRCLATETLLQLHCLMMVKWDALTPSVFFGAFARQVSNPFSGDFFTLRPLWSPGMTIGQSSRKRKSSVKWRCFHSCINNKSRLENESGRESKP